MKVESSISVVDIEALQDKIAQSGKRATIIICVETKVTLKSIYHDLMQADLNADVFDYFENEIEFSESEFYLDGEAHMLYEHSFN